jgi:hypothetical protein
LKLKVWCVQEIEQGISLFRMAGVKGASQFYLAAEWAFIDMPSAKPSVSEAFGGIYCEGAKCSF